MKRAAVLGVVAALLAGRAASAQPAPTPPVPPPPLRRPAAPRPIPALVTTTPTNLRAHVGTDNVARLLRSADPEERIRGIQRAAAIGTADAIGLVVDTLERGSSLKSDTRAVLAVARALAPHSDQERARAGLLAIVAAGNPSLAGRLPSPRIAASDGFDDGDPLARAELARQTAAIALARSGGERALESLYGIARGGGGGQSAAIFALGVHPPRDPGFFGSPGTTMPAAVVRLLGQLGDLRALDVLGAAARSGDVAIRSAALVSLAELGDARAIGLARTAIAETDLRLRAAAGEAFVVLGAPERFKATAALVADDATTAIGLRLADRVSSPEITKLVTTRALESREPELRHLAIRALGRAVDPSAAKALLTPALLEDRELAYFALSALARSPAPNAGELLAGLLGTKHAPLATRAWIVRALVRGDKTGYSAIEKLASSGGAHRALGVFAKVALGEADPELYLADKEPRVRRAAAAASAARPRSASRERRLLERIEREDDPTTRQLLALALLGGDPEGIVKTSVLVERAESGQADAPLAAYALARRADEKTARKVGQLLAAKDAMLRAHVARGLGVSALADASGRLADAYEEETDVEVRRALVFGLASRTGDLKAPARARTLALASELDPDGPVRQLAKRARAVESGAPTPPAQVASGEVAWLKATLDGGAAPGAPLTGAFVRPDGVAVPIAFDEDGYALVVGLPPGEGRLVLAPRIPTDKTPSVR